MENGLKNLLDTDSTKLAVGGCGTIGSAWAALFSLKGYTVYLYDISPEAVASGVQRASSLLDGIADAGLSDPRETETAKNRLIASPDGKGLDGIALIQESVVEDYGIKAAFHQKLESMIPEQAVIVSSSSGLLPGQMQEKLKHPERFLVGHPFHPVHLIPLVELVPGPKTDEQVLTRVKTFFEHLDKVPVVLKKEVRGYLGNRLAAAVWREATHLVEQGVASVEDVDKALYAGLGLRYAFMGQHLIYHLAGGEGGYRHFFDTLVPGHLEPVLADLAKWEKTPSGTLEKLTDGLNAAHGGKSVGEIAAWRDKRLVELLKLLYQRNPDAPEPPAPGRV